jgi:hypothetical protein
VRGSEGSFRINDDNDDAREATEEIMRNEGGYEVVAGANGRAALLVGHTSLAYEPVDHLRESLGLERFRKELCGRLMGPAACLGLSGNDQYGDPDFPVTELSKEGHAIQSRQSHVQNHSVEFTRVLAEDRQRLGSIDSQLDRAPVMETLRHQLENVLVVLDDEHAAVRRFHVDRFASIAPSETCTAPGSPLRKSPLRVVRCLVDDRPMVARASTVANPFDKGRHKL